MDYISRQHEGRNLILFHPNAQNFPVLDKSNNALQSMFYFPILVHPRPPPRVLPFLAPTSRNHDTPFNQALVACCIGHLT